MPASSQTSPAPRSRRRSWRRHSWTGAGLVVLALGCPAPRGEPTESPADAPTGDSSTKAAAPVGADAPSGPRVLFAVSDGVLAPLSCHDGDAVLPADTTECMDLAPVGELVVLDTGARATLGEAVEAPCNGTELNRFTGRLAAEGPLADGRFAVWPMTASQVLKLEDATLAASADELAAMVALLQKETEGQFEVEPALRITSGLVADVDGDGKPDRAFAAHEDGRLYGVVAAFLARDPKRAVPLSVMQFDAPRIVGTTDVDGRPGRELLVEAEFVEGIEDRVVVSAFSRRVLALHDGVAAEVGSWGCRMF